MKWYRNRYKRRYRRKHYNIFSTVRISLNVLGYIFLLPFLIPIGIYKLIKYIAKNQRKNNKELNQNYNDLSQQTDITPPQTATIPTYYKENQYEQKRLITKNEEQYEAIIRKYIPQNYTLQPQICLASVIQKNYKNQHATELFRIVDFGIFDEERKTVCLIEINDSSHEQHDRIIRDLKVKELCKSANIPLLTFWTRNGINELYIKQRLEEYCK